MALQPESGLDWNTLFNQEFCSKPVSDEEQEAYWDRRAATFVCGAPGKPDAPGVSGTPGSTTGVSANEGADGKGAGGKGSDGKGVGGMGAGGSSYIKGFLERAGIRPGETVIDMGCGPGSLAIPIARGENRVTACDLSGKMLERLVETARETGVEGLIDVRKTSWLADWDDLPVADVFIASRSLCCNDLLSTIEKIERHTRRCCCMTLSTLDSPMHDRTMLAAIGRPDVVVNEAVYLVNLLFSMGRLPEVSYLSHVRPSFGDTPEALYEEFAREDGPFTVEEDALLRRFIERNFEFEGAAGGAAGGVGAAGVSGMAGGAAVGVGVPKRKYDRMVRWAFVKWDVPETGR